MFIDYAKVFVRGGDGGDGCLAFRREKYVPRGGPSGGNGGGGGNVILRTTTHLTTLLPFRYKREFKAERGAHGSGNNREGRSGKDLIVELPVGTQIVEAGTSEIVFDFDTADLDWIAARGGRGGRGNASFATATNQAPRRFEPGSAGGERHLILELKTLADVGLIGLPNAGKSTLISVLSAARPRIADYPFTTLTPNLGVVSWGEYESFVVADIPGLIEGAHRGAGLGDQFLRHVERNALLVHLIDVSPIGREDPVEAAHSIQLELELYDEGLSRKPQIWVATKLDVAIPERLAALRRHSRQKDIPFFEISAVSGKGISQLKLAIGRLLSEIKS